MCLKAHRSASGVNQPYELVQMYGQVARRESGWATVIPSPDCHLNKDMQLLRTVHMPWPQPFASQ